ncbi:MAG: exo-alpha-sialidase [Aestuariivirga sp.]
MKTIQKLTFASSMFVVLGISLGTISPAFTETLEQLGSRTHYHGIAFARSGTATLLLASHHGLFALTRDGRTSLVSQVQDYMGFSPNPADPLSYYASGHPPGGGNSGFLESTDGGTSWKQLSSGVGGPVDFHQMDVSPADPKTIYGSFGQLQVSRDAGKNWSIAGTPPAGLISLAASSVSSDQLYAATKKGLYVSKDAGASWNSLEFSGEVVSTVKVGTDNSLYAFVVGRGLMKASESTSIEWALLSNKFGEAIPLHIAIDSTNPNHLALTTQENGVLESIDGGLTWTPFGRT